MNIKIAEMEQKRAEHRRKRVANKLVSESGSSFDEEEEFEELPNDKGNTNASESEEEDKIPSQPDLVEEPESPLPFRIHRPAP